MQLTIRTANGTTLLGAAQCFVLWVGIFALYLTSRYSYLLFHSLVELVRIILMGGIFVLAWHSRGFPANGFLQVIGISSLFIGSVETLHALTFKGLGIFKEYDANLPTQLWIVFRYMEAVAYVVAALAVSRRPAPWATALIALVTTAVLLATVFTGIFPDCFMEGHGLTDFKIVSEYVIIGLFLGSLGLLFQRRQQFDSAVLLAIMGSIIVGIFGEISFTRYASVYGFANELGHYFLYISAYLLYRAILVTGLVEPFDLLFRDLKEKETELETRIIERTRQLTESEKRFRTMADTAPVLIWISGEDKLCNWFNKVWLDFTGRSMEQEMGNGWAEGVHADDFKRCLDTYVTAFDARQEFSMEYRLRRFDGEFRWFIDNGVPRYDDQGKFLGYIGSCVDITERKLAEEALRKSEESLRLGERQMAISQEIGSTGSWVYDIATNGIRASANSLALFGFPPVARDYPLDAFLACIPEQDRVRQTLSDAISEERTYDDEYEMNPADGSPSKEIHSIGSLEKDAQGNPLRVLGFIQDITELKKSNADRNRLLKIIEEAPDFIAMSDMQAHLTYLNRAGARLVGLPDDADLSPLEIEDMHPEWATRRVLDEGVPAVLQNGYWQGETALLHRGDRHETPVLQMLLLHRDEFGRPECLSTIMRDITERKKAETELLRSNAELEQFSYAISHDMRQPLRMISSYMQLLEKALADHLDAEKQQHFNFAIDGAKRMDAMMLGLLEYSRVGRKGEPPASTESHALLDEALLFLQPTIAETRAVVRIEGAWPLIHVSPNEILRLMQNLIGNALKFRVSGRKPEVTVTSETTGNEWRLCVTDNGIGILPDQIGRLFQVFQRLQSRADYEGTGIGLALCRKIAEHHGGRIWVESAGEGQGSAFRVQLPLAEPESLERQEH